MIEFDFGCRVQSENVTDFGLNCSFELFVYFFFIDLYGHEGMESFPMVFLKVNPLADCFHLLYNTMIFGKSTRLLDSSPRKKTRLSV